MILDLTDQQLEDAFYEAAKEDSDESEKLKAEMIRRGLMGEA